MLAKATIDNSSVERASTAQPLLVLVVLVLVLIIERGGVPIG